MSNKYEGMHTQCTHKGAHYPHVVGHYDTVRYGRLEKFCMGVPKEFNSKGQATKKGYYKITHNSPGDAAIPSEFHWEYSD